MSSARATNRSGPTAVHLMVQVWGDFYTGALVDLCIPALLSPRNLPALASTLPCQFDVYTTARDEARIRSAPILERLRRVVDVRFHRIDPDGVQDKYALMTDCNISGLKEAAASDAAVVFLVPDTIWSDGSLETVARAIRAGKRAVMQTGVRVTAETALPVIRRQFVRDAEGIITVGARELVRIAFDHMHPYFLGWFWDASRVNRNPAVSYWRVGSHGLIARCFHLHPLMLYCARPVFDFVSTLDDDLPLLAIPDYHDIYVVEDSDEVFHIDLSEEGALGAGKALEAGPSAAYLATWARFSANLYHRRFLEHRIRFHAYALGPEWRSVERESDGVIREVRLRLWLWRVRLLLAEIVLGVSREAVIDRAAASRLTWSSVPEPPAWWRLAVNVLRASGFVAAAERLERSRRDVFVRVAQNVFGISVACRALGLDARALKRAQRARGASLWKPALGGFLLRPSFKGFGLLFLERTREGAATARGTMRLAGRGAEHGAARARKRVRKGMRRVRRDGRLASGRIRSRIARVRKTAVRWLRRFRRTAATAPRRLRVFLLQTTLRVRRGWSSDSDPTTPPC